MTNEFPLELQKIIFQAEYRTLSRVREEFPRKSNHKATVYIEKELSVILDKINEIDNKLNELKYGKKS